MRMDCSEDLLDIETSFEILNEDVEDPLPLGEVLSPVGAKILDMTGRETKEYRSFRDMREAQPLREGGKKRRFWELSFADQLANFVDQQIVNDEIKLMALDKKSEYDDNVRSTLRIESDRLNRLIDQQLSTEAIYSRILKMLQLCLDRCGSVNHLAYLGFLQTTYAEMSQDCLEEMNALHLDDAFVELAQPVLERLVECRHLARDREEIADAFDVLRGREGKTVGVRDVLLWEVLAPAIKAFMMSWNAREPEPAIALVEALSDRVPEWLTHHCIGQDVIPRLHLALESWNPLADTVPLDTWVHPWLPHIGRASLDVLLALIREKLSDALRHWHPSDDSARLILQAWKPPVFSPGVWHAFMVSSILPKLDVAMRDSFQVSPSNQDLSVWKWVMAWHGTIEDQSIVQTLQRHFFPRFTQTLRAWLSVQGADYAEIANWFSGWKFLLPESLRQHPLVEHQLSDALAIMRGALAGNEAPHMEQEEPEVLGRPVFYHGGIGNEESPLGSARDILERIAMERNIVFVPCPPQTDTAGHRLYRFGNRRIYFDRFTIYAADEQRTGFRRISLDELLASV